MKVFMLPIALTLMLSSLSAQDFGSLSGKIVKDEKPVAAATVSLLRAKDSSVVKLSTSNTTGVFIFEKIPYGNYIISVTAVGHQKAFSAAAELSAGQPTFKMPDITMTPVSKELAAVTVSSKRPLIEVKIDRTVLNVDASVTNIGISALELLEKSPGVSVDRDGNISLKGKEGVLIMVDGRPTQLGGADLANFLRNLSSNQLDQIEIMTNPPARYDASGTSGVINIKTKKIIKAGLNGSVSAAYSQGKYPKTNEGFNFNYRAGKLNLFTNLSHNYMKRFAVLKITRNILDSDNKIDKVFNQVADRLMSGNAYSAKFGIDFFANKNTTFGAVVNLNSRQNSSFNPNISNISNADSELQSVTQALVDNQFDWKSLNSNFNFRTILDKKGKEITADLDVIKHRSDNDLFMVNSFNDAAGNPYQKADTLTGRLPQTIDIYSARVDYLHPMAKNGRFEAGIKTSIVTTDNNARYDSIQFGEVIHDLGRSNHFIYEENINAVYANLSTSLSKKITAQFGLRVENTNAKGRQKSTGETFDRHYTQIFPTAYFQYKVNEKNVLGANFGRRVSRPGYQNLNPFIRFIDRYTFSQGNPNLKPSVSSNIELTHTWKNQITTTLNYTHVNGIIHEVIQQKGLEAYNMPANVSSLNQFGIAVNANNTITKWWTSNVSINVYNDRYKGSINGAIIDRSASSYVLNATQQFKINKTLTAELNGRYRSGWLEGIMKVKPVGFVGAGISQQIMKNQGSLRLTVRDMFFTQKLHGLTKYGNVDLAMSQYSDTQVVTIGFTYNFSKGKKLSSIKRTAGSANDEQNRIGQ